jgi:hypothetical protein
MTAEAAASFSVFECPRVPVGEDDLEVTARPGFDGRFDEFRAGWRSRNPHLPLAVRTRELLVSAAEQPALDRGRCR